MKRFDVYNAARGYTQSRIPLEEFASVVAVFELRKIEQLAVGETYKRINETLSVKRVA